MALLCLLGPVRSFALDPAKNVYQYNCQSWTRREDLPANSINAITQTKDGYLWFGTSKGLIRFDGLEFKEIGMPDHVQFRSRIISSLASSKAGGLWFGINSGSLGYYDGQNFFPATNVNWVERGMDVRSIREDSNGVVWVAAQAVTGRFVKGTTNEMSFSNRESGNEVSDGMSLCCGSHGRVWMGTVRRDLYYLQDGKLNLFPDDSVNKSIIFALAEDSAGQIWIGTDSGLRCYDASFQRKEIGDPHYEVRALLVDRHGVVWAGTSGNGLMCYKNGKLTTFKKNGGLINDFVTALFEDREGSLWIGTSDGLSQLTDLKFPIFSSTEGLIGGSCHAVCASQAGGLWAAMSGGISRFDGKQARNYTGAEGLTNLYIKRVFEAKDGDVYLTDGSTVGIISEGKLVARYAPPAMPVAMAEDSQGVIVSAVSNLFRVSRNQFVPYSFKNGQAPPFIWIYNLVVARDDSLWVASVNGIFRVKDGAWQQWSVPQGLSWVKVHWIFEDSDGVIWAGGPAGMARLKYNQIRNITRANGLFDDFIFAIVPDDLGYFWVDSARGIFRVSRQNLNDFCDGKTDQVKCEAYDGLEMVKTIDKTDQEWSGCKTKDGRIWFPSSQGVVMIDPAKLRVNSTPPPVYIKQVSANGVLVKDWNAAVTLSGKNESGSQTSPDWKPSVYSETDGLLGGSCHAVSPSQNGGVWATMNMGVSCFEGNQSRNYTAKQLPNAYIKRILEAKDGDVYLTDADKAVEILAHGKIVARYTNSIWPVALTEDAQGVVVSVGGDLFRVDRNRFAPYPFKNGQAPPCYWIFNLTTGRDGSLWIATVNGIFQVKDGTFQQWSVPEGLPASNVYWVCEDNEGVIWAGLPTGVARLKNNRFRNITRADGLFDDVIYAMVPDNAGFFWVNSSQGVFRVSRKDLNDFADGRTDRVKCEFYRETEGTDQEYSGCMSRDGCIWFPSSVGVLKIDPSKLPNDGDRPFAGSGHVRLGPSIPVGKGELEFQFFALSYVAPQHIRYRFQLEGWNKDWIECGNQRSAFYTNLKPGKYRFRVEACNADGVWSTTGDSFAVELLPHFYQTTWFYMGCAVLVSAALMGIYAWRMGHLRRRQNQLQKAQELLEAKVEERTEELEAQKTRLESEIEERKRMQLEVERVHRLLVDASRQAGQAEVASSVLHNVGNVLNSVNTSASIITDQVRDSKVADVSQVAELLIEHQNDLAEFLVQQGRGEPVTNYLKALGQRLVSEQATMLNELQELVRNIDHIKEIVAMQQSYAQVSGIMDKQSIPTLVDDALRMHAAALARHQVQVVRQFDPIPDVLVDKHKVLQILVNLISNAKYALSESAAKERRLALGVKLDENNLVRVSVADNGVGIPEENLDRIFSLGFTTRQNGHGLGLHSGFFAAREMGGTLLVHSDGPGKGATFTLVFPAQPKEKS